MASHKKIDWIRPTRRIPIQLRDPVRRHARQAGEIIWCWNLLNDHLFDLFVLLLESTSWSRSFDIGHAIWNTFQSDKAQREMLLNTAKAAFPPEQKFKAALAPDLKREFILPEIGWLVRQVDDLAKHRNDVAHVPIRFGVLDEKTVVLSVITASGRSGAVERLRKQPTSEIWLQLRGDLLALTGYAWLLSMSIRRDGRPPWPRRPLLRCVPMNIQKPTPKGHRPPSATRKPPPKS